MNRPKMAKFLCSICRNQTVAALLAAMIYSKAAQKDMKNRDTLIQIAEVFIKGIQFSTEKALQELKTKVNRGYDQQVEGFEEQTEGFKKQVEDFKNIKVKYSLYLAI
ncbi:unnamed protein product [Rotaria sordida]|uniref:Uncharacterized protein n=1 Tax=Rotaria sordida TaxID=392033 RepID=A0A815ME55_9BILA|nr:unnamed protein product [Rotaria sordida]